MDRQLHMPPNMSNETRDAAFPRPVVALSVIAMAGCTAAATGADDPLTSSIQWMSSVQSKCLPSEKDEGNQDPSQATTSTNDFATVTTNGFFANLGTNGRTCNTCHLEQDAWTLTPGSAQALSAHDPHFAPFDGSDCPPTSPSRGPDKSFSSEVTEYGLIRVQIGIPEDAGFTLESATNPTVCSIAPGSAGVGGQLFLFRRPLPSTNLVFDTTIT
jgi:hypothetical protein